MSQKRSNKEIFAKIMVFTKPYKWRFNAIIIWSVLLSVFAALRPYLLKQTVDEFIEPKDQHGLFIFISFMLIALLMEVLSQFFFVYWANWLGQDIVKDLRNKLFKHITNFKMRYFDNTAVGQLVTRSVFDIESIAKIFSQGLFMIISDLMKMIVAIIFMLYMNYKLTLIVLIAMPFLLYATRIFQKKMKGAFEEVRTQIARLNSFVQERLTGIKIVQLFSREHIEHEKFKEINNRHRKAWLKNVMYNSVFFPIADIFSSITLGIVVWYGAGDIIQGGTTTMGDLVTYTMLVTMLFTPLRQIADKFNEMQMGMIAANRVFDILEEDLSQENGTVIAESLDGIIEFEEVRFGYKTDEEVLKGINLKINKGETVAIVGSTGAGKTTIINLLNRFYEINQGTILIDGRNINEYEIGSLRKQISVVLQDVFLFADTIYNNITLFNADISREEVILASKQIGLHDFIESLPNGYDYNVKERGVMLSSGQRQLIAFLRAYVSKPSILILDEATSSIDSYSEDMIQKATNELTKGRTSIIIAHRLSTVINAHQIIVMDKGQIVEKGTHRELLEKENGYYKNLYDSQFAL